MNVEQRSFLRAPFGGMVRLWDWEKVLSARAREVCAGGVFVETAVVLPEGAHLTVRLELPGYGGLTVLAKVVRTVHGGLLASAGMGLRFLDLSPSQRQKIQSFVERRRSARADFLQSEPRGQLISGAPLGV